MDEASWRVTSTSCSGLLRRQLIVCYSQTQTPGGGLSDLSDLVDLCVVQRDVVGV